MCDWQHAYVSSSCMICRCLAIVFTGGKEYRSAFVFPCERLVDDAPMSRDRVLGAA